MVHTNRVGAELLHQSSIKLALGSVHERVVFDELVGNTCVEQS